MTVENQDNKKYFEGDSVTTLVTFTFRVLQETDLKIYVYPEDLDFDDLETYLVSSNDYTVDLEDDGEGGSITFDTAPATGTIGLIKNDLAITQTANLPTEGNFNEETVETALDRIVMQNIQQQEELSRAISIKIEDPLAQSGTQVFVAASTDRGGQVLLWSEDGDVIEAATISSLGEDLDTILSSLTVGDLLQWNGSNWVNVDLGNVIDGLATATPEVGDTIPFKDISDGNNPKEATYTQIFTLYAGITHQYTGAQIAGSTALTSSAASIAINMASNNDFTHTFTEDTTLANPTNAVAGQAGAIRFTQHASSPKTLAYGSNWKFPGGVAPSVTASNGAADTLYYYVRSSTFIEANLVKGFA